MTKEQREVRDAVRKVWDSKQRRLTKGALAKLSAQQRAVINGERNGTPRAEIARDLGVSRERTRALEVSAKRVLLGDELPKEKPTKKAKPAKREASKRASKK